MSPLEQGATPGSRQMPSPFSESLRVITGHFLLSREKLLWSGRPFAKLTRRQPPSEQRQLDALGHAHRLRLP
jgi:hypothetical protein